MRLVHPPLRVLGSLLWRLEHAFERARALDASGRGTRLRIFAVMFGFALLFGWIATGAAHSALMSGTPSVATRMLPDAVGRADIVDRNGQLLATNIRHYALYVQPDEVWDRAHALRAIRRAVPRVPERQLRNAMEASRRAFVMGGLEPAEREALMALGLGGIYFENEDRRVYPLGGTAAHLVGFTDSHGGAISGVERALDTRVRASGARGQPVPLSIDLRVQAALEQELRAAMADQQATGAVGIVTDVHTGEILALASLPDFDPNRQGEMADERKLNRAAASVYEMGSTFKIFTVAMALDAGIARLDTTFDATEPLRVGGRAVRDFHAQNRVMTTEEVFLHSSNIGTSRMNIGLGGDRVRDYFEGFGLLAPAPSGLPEAARPRQPTNWRDQTLISLSYGYATMVTPLHMAASVGAILNGGLYVPLTFEPRGRQGVPQGRRVVSEETSRQMLHLMRQNVVRGSGTRADIPGLRVGGKTGSAEKAVNGRYDRTRMVSSFASVFPSEGALDAPRYLVFILIDEPRGSTATHGLRTAGFVAAPVAGRVIDRIAGFLNVERLDDPRLHRYVARDPLPETLSDLSSLAEYAQ